MNDIHIRDMREADIPAVAAIGRGASELKTNEDDEFWGEELLKDWVAGDDVMLVVEAEGKVVGFMLTQLHTATKAGYLSDIAIDPDWRGHGIGSRLIEAVLARLKERGIEYVYGLTKVENEKIHGLLKKFGFVQGNAFYWFERYLDS
jgi:[ribosomal protein S18]-alanine N-acetyltransferase